MIKYNVQIVNTIVNIHNKIKEKNNGQVCNSGTDQASGRS